MKDRQEFGTRARMMQRWRRVAWSIILIADAGLLAYGGGYEITHHVPQAPYTGHGNRADVPADLADRARACRGDARPVAVPYPTCGLSDCRLRVRRRVGSYDLAHPRQRWRDRPAETFRLVARGVQMVSDGVLAPAGHQLQIYIA